MMRLTWGMSSATPSPPSRYTIIIIIAFTSYTGQQAQYERADESPTIQKESKKVQKKIMIDIDNM